MKAALSRRSFLKHSSILTLGSAISSVPLISRGVNPGREKVRVAIIGCNGRGMDHIKGYLALPNAEISWICDVDSRAIEKGVAAVSKSQPRKLQTTKDLRRVLEDPNVDAVSIAVPDHWHAPAAILACAAGKHVYVEKPGSHNPHESELIVSAARKHKRIVQMGNQRRSWPWVIEALQSIRAGEIGRLSFARAWYTNHRASIGHGKPTAIPDWLDYSMWQGPAPEKPFHDNVLHYNWHWFWHWGTGELGNNGVHFLDLARWGLEVDSPRRIVCGGNRYHFHDDQQTPDTYIVSFDYGDKGIAWEGRSCDPRGFESEKVGVCFYGENGSATISGNNFRVYDLNDKLLREVKGKFDDVLHFGNFTGAILNGQKLNSEIEDGQKSTLLCHLGNIAWRTGHTLNYDPEKQKLSGDKAAAALWSRRYRKGWEPKV